MITGRNNSFESERGRTYAGARPPSTIGNCQTTDGTLIMSKLPIRATGLAWYNREDYPRILQIMEDADKLPPNFEKWQYAAHKAESQIKASGMIVVRAVIDPDEFVAYCSRHNLKVDAQARTRFASEIAAGQVRSTH